MASRHIAMASALWKETHRNVVGEGERVALMTVPGTSPIVVLSLLLGSGKRPNTLGLQRPGVLTRRACLSCYLAPAVHMGARAPSIPLLTKDAQLPRRGLRGWHS